MRSTGGKVGCGTLILGAVGFIFLIAIISNAIDSQDSTSQPAQSQPQTGPTVDLTFTSDPEGAVLYINGEQAGLTPTTVSLPEGEYAAYRIVADEPYDDYDLYEPYGASFTPTKDEAISVWLERTTAEEQATQREQAEQARREREEAQRRAEAEREAELEAQRLYYRIDTNCARGADLTYTNHNGDTTQQGNQGSGWYYYFHPSDGQYMYLSAQNQCDYGYITVKFVQNGITIRENTSTGAYVIATISGRW